MTHQERQAYSKAVILQAAMDEFGSRDYNQVNMETICKNHCISKGMMYHYYSNKDELFLLCAQKTFDDLKVYVEQNMTTSGTEDPLQHIQHYFMIRESFFQLYPLQKRVFETALFRTPEHLKDDIRTLREPIRQLNLAFLEQLTSDIPLRPGLNRNLVTHYLENIESLFREVVFCAHPEKGSQDLHTVLETVTEVLDIFLFGVLQQNSNKSDWRNTR